MRILYDNVLRVGDFSVTSVNLNFPVENLWSNSLLKSFKSSGATTTLTFTFTEAIPLVSTLAIANSNLENLNVTVTGDGVSVYNFISSDLVWNDENRSIIYLEDFAPAQTNVTQIEFEMITLSSVCEVGNLAVGSTLQIDYFSEQPQIGYRNTVDSFKNIGGYLFKGIGTVLETFSFNIDAVNIENYRLLEDFLKTVKNDTAFWVDRWEGSEEFRPYYCHNTTDFNFTKSVTAGILFDNFRLEFEEVV